MNIIKDMDLFRQRCFGNGQWLEAENGGTMPVINPSSGKQIGTVPSLTGPQVDKIIDAAHAAWPAWRSKTAKSRAVILRHWFDLILENSDDLAKILTLEQGKPLAEAQGEVVYAASFVEWYAEEAKRVYGDIIPSPQAENRLVVIKEPIGVCAAITPWNFPAAMVTRKAAPALAAGCPVVLKPASETPFTALALAELAHRAGIPAGIFNVVTGKSSDIGKRLATHPLVRKVTFTGSTEVGKLLMRQSADSVKKVGLELGGHAPFIVFDDADIDKAVEGAMLSKYRNTGQTCVCANRIMVQDGVHDLFIGKLKEKVQTLKVADGFEPGAQQGPLINAQAVEKVEAHILDAVAKGATLLAGGDRHALGGTFFEPTILAGVTREMDIAHEETFGPVAPILRFESETEAIQMANDTEFGLAAYFYSHDIGRVWRVSEALEYGIIGVNTGIISNEMSPFGGVKQSGIGREGSKYGIEDFMEIKYICMGGID
jgi:succinate-semialdehyde dehydrogenase / glutarate-semialdehyde dehydrogenase